MLVCVAVKVVVEVIDVIAGIHHHVVHAAGRIDQTTAHIMVLIIQLFEIGVDAVGVAGVGGLRLGQLALAGLLKEVEQLVLHIGVLFRQNDRFVQQHGGRADQHDQCDQKQQLAPDFPPRIARNGDDAVQKPPKPSLGGLFVCGSICLGGVRLRDRLFFGDAAQRFRRRGLSRLFRRRARTGIAAVVRQGDLLRRAEALGAVGRRRRVRRATHVGRDRLI